MNKINQKLDLILEKLQMIEIDSNKEEFKNVKPEYKTQIIKLYYEIENMDDLDTKSKLLKVINVIKKLELDVNYYIAICKKNDHLLFNLFDDLRCFHYKNEILYNYFNNNNNTDCKHFYMFN